MEIEIFKKVNLPADPNPRNSIDFRWYVTRKYGKDVNEDSFGAEWQYRILDDGTVRIYLTEDNICLGNYRIPVSIECEDGVVRSVTELYIHSVYYRWPAANVGFCNQNQIRDVFIDYPDDDCKPKASITSNGLFFYYYGLGEIESPYIVCEDGSLYKRDSKGEIDELIFLYTKDDNFQLRSTITKIRPYACILEWNCCAHVSMPVGVKNIPDNTFFIGTPHEIDMQNVCSIAEQAFPHRDIDKLCFNALASQIKIGDKLREYWSGHDKKYNLNVKDIQFKFPEDIHGRVISNSVIELHQALDPHTTMSIYDGMPTDGAPILIDLSQVIDKEDFARIVVISSVGSPWKYYGDSREILTKIEILANETEHCKTYLVYESMAEVNDLINQSKQIVYISDQE